MYIEIRDNLKRWLLGDFVIKLNIELQVVQTENQKSLIFHFSSRVIKYQFIYRIKGITNVYVTSYYKVRIV